MRAALKTAGLAAVLAVGAFWSGAARAEDKNLPTPAAFAKAIEERGRPGPEHAKLEPFVGDWILAGRMWTDPSQPPLEFKGTVQRKWVMDGRFVQESVKIECESGKTFEGLGMLGYDKGRKAYTAMRACGFCGTSSHGLLTADSSGTKFECAKEECCPLTGQKVTGRDEIVVENPDRIVMSIYRNIGGKELKVMEFVSTRKK